MFVLRIVLEVRHDIMDMDERRGSSCGRTDRACERARRSALGEETHRRQSQVSVSERESVGNERPHVFEM